MSASPTTSSFNMDDTYGSMLIGTFFATFFQGILSVQAYVYYESFPNDPWLLKTMVAAVWSLDLAHLFLISQAVYHYLITNWGNPPALLESTEPLDLHLVLVSLATILCQGFFLRRVHTFSKQNWLLTVTLALACLSTVGIDIYMSVASSRNKSVAVFSALGKETLARFSLGAAVDLAIAVLLVHYLCQGKTSFESTNFVLNKIIQYTVATGLATSLLAIAAVIAHAIRPEGFIYIAIHFSIGRMYTNALLATLNSRRALRSTLGSTAWSGSGLGPTTESQSAFIVTQTRTTTTDYPLNQLGGKRGASVGIQPKDSWMNASV